MRNLEETLYTAVDLVNARRYTEAIGIYENALQTIDINPFLNWIHVDLANCYHALGDRQKSIEHLLEAEKNPRGDFKSEFLTGSLFKENEVYDRAKIHLMNAAKIDSKDDSALRELSYTYGACGEFDKALEYQRAATSLNPNYDNLCNQGVLTSQIGTTRGIRKLVEEGRDLLRFATSQLGVPQEENIYLQELAVCEYELGNYSVAIEILEKMVQEQPENFSLRSELGECYTHMYEHAKAKPHLEKAIELKKNLPLDKMVWTGKRKQINHKLNLAKDYINLGEANWGLENGDPVIEFYNKGLELEYPNRVFVKSKIGTMYFYAKNYNEAEKIFLEILKEDPECPYGYEGLGGVALKREKYEEALRQTLTGVEKNRTYKTLNNSAENCANMFLEIFKSLNARTFGVRKIFDTLKDAVESTNFRYAGSLALISFFTFAGESLRGIDLTSEAATLLEDSDEDRSLMRTVGKSRNSVKETNLKFAHTIKGIEYVLKSHKLDPSLPNSGGTFQREYTMEMFVATMLESYLQNHPEIPPATQQPIAFLNNTKHEILIKRKIDTENLKEFSKKASIEELNHESMLISRNLAMIHGLTTPYLQKEGDKFWVRIADSQGNVFVTDLPKFRYEENLQRRFLSRMHVSDELKRDFMKAYKNCIDVDAMESFDFIIHGDTNACNSGVGGFIWDWEMACVGNPVYDLLHFLSNVDYRDVDRGSAINTYYGQLQAVRITQDLQRISATGTDNLEHILLCKIGSNINQGEIERAKLYETEVTKIFDQQGHHELIDALRKITVVGYTKPHKTKMQLNSGETPETKDQKERALKKRFGEYKIIQVAKNILNLRGKIWD